MPKSTWQTPKKRRLGQAKVQYQYVGMQMVKGKKRPVYRRRRDGRLMYKTWKNTYRMVNAYAPTAYEQSRRTAYKRGSYRGGNLCPGELRRREFAKAFDIHGAPW